MERQTDRLSVKDGEPVDLYRAIEVGYIIECFFPEQVWKRHTPTPPRRKPAKHTQPGRICAMCIAFCTGLNTNYTPKRSSQLFRVLTQMTHRKYRLVTPPELCGPHPRGQLIPLRSCRWADAEWSARPSLLRTHSGNEQALCRRYGRDASESSSAITPGRL